MWFSSGNKAQFHDKGQTTESWAMSTSFAPKKILKLTSQEYSNTHRTGRTPEKTADHFRPSLAGPLHGKAAKNLDSQAKPRLQSQKRQPGPVSAVSDPTMPVPAPQFLSDSDPVFTP
jgi:hypothetical protein